MSVRPRVLVVTHEDHAGLGRLAPGLAAHVELDVRPAHRGAPLPADLTGLAGLVVLGGAMGACDDDLAPWLPATRALLAAATDAAVPTLGICLGAQLLAVATGGQVERGAAGLELGVLDVTLTPDGARDPLLAGAGPTVTAAQFHQDSVVALPPGAVLLATGTVYHHQAFRIGDGAWGVQYHPEVTLEDFTAWVRGEHASVRAAGFDPDAVLADLVRSEAALAAVARRHAAAFAATVRAHAGAAT